MYGLCHVELFDLKTNGTITLHVVCMRRQLVIRTTTVVLSDLKSFLIILDTLKGNSIWYLSFYNIENNELNVSKSL